MRFYSCYNGISNEDSNKGRICIGDMTFYPSEYSMPVSTYEAPFEPEKWDKYMPGYGPEYSQLVNATNCYEYALNAKLNPASGNPEPIDPGFSENEFLGNGTEPIDIDLLLNYLKADSANYGFEFREIGKNERADQECYKVALYVDDEAPSYDYHWYRQNPDGSWSSKFKRSFPSKLDFADKLIMDPDKCSREKIGSFNNYRKFIGFFQLKPLNIEA